MPPRQDQGRSRPARSPASSTVSPGQHRDVAGDALDDHLEHRRGRRVVHRRRRRRAWRPPPAGVKRSTCTRSGITPSPTSAASPPLDMAARARRGRRGRSRPAGTTPGSSAAMRARSSRPCSSGELVLLPAQHVHHRQPRRGSGPSGPPAAAWNMMLVGAAVAVEQHEAAARLAAPARLRAMRQDRRDAGAGGDREYVRGAAAGSGSRPKRPCRAASPRACRRPAGARSPRWRTARRRRCLTATRSSPSSEAARRSNRCGAALRRRSRGAACRYWPGLKRNASRSSGGTAKATETASAVSRRTSVTSARGSRRHRLRAQMALEIVERLARTPCSATAPCRRSSRIRKAARFASSRSAGRRRVVLAEQARGATPARPAGRCRRRSSLRAALLGHPVGGPGRRRARSRPRPRQAGRARARPRPRARSRPSPGSRNRSA